MGFMAHHPATCATKGAAPFLAPNAGALHLKLMGLDAHSMGGAGGAA